MENVWDATKLMFIIYGMAAVVSFLVAWVIKLTFAAIRMHGGRSEAVLEPPPKAPAAKPAKGA